MKWFCHLRQFFAQLFCRHAIHGFDEPLSVFNNGESRNKFHAPLKAHLLDVVRWIIVSSHVTSNTTWWTLGAVHSSCGHGVQLHTGDREISAQLKYLRNSQKWWNGSVIFAWSSLRFSATTRAIDLTNQFKSSPWVNLNKSFYCSPFMWSFQWKWNLEVDGMWKHATKWMMHRQPCEQ